MRLLRFSLRLGFGIFRWLRVLAVFDAMAVAAGIARRLTL